MKYLTRPYEVSLYRDSYTSGHASDHVANTAEDIQAICVHAISNKSTATVHMSRNEYVSFNGETMHLEVWCSPMKSMECPDYYPIKDAIEAVINIHKVHS